MVNNKFIVVSVNRGSYSSPGFKVEIEARVSSVEAGNRFIIQRVLAAYEKQQNTFRNGSHWHRRVHVRMDDLRVVDEMGFKRLEAAVKADRTRRRKKSAAKAAKTRAKAKAYRERMAVEARANEQRASIRRDGSPPEYRPAVADYEVN